MDLPFSGNLRVDRDDVAIVGNVYPKYTTRNPIARYLVQRFLATLTQLYQRVSPRSVLEVGCGEGYLAQHLLRSGACPERFEACDLSLSQIAAGIDPFIRFRQASIYSLPYANGEFELVVCCEVLEHLDDPERALAELARVTRRAALISTPHEPLWRILNLLRGSYWSAWGNTPGHRQHFSRAFLHRLVRYRFRLLEHRCSLPWLVVLAELPNVSE